MCLVIRLPRMISLVGRVKGCNGKRESTRRRYDDV